MFHMREDLLTMQKKRRVFSIKRLKRHKQNMVLTKERLKPAKNHGLMKHKSPKGNMVIVIEMQKC